MTSETTVILFVDTMKQYRDRLEEARSFLTDPTLAPLKLTPCVLAKVSEVIDMIDLDIRNAKRVSPLTEVDCILEALRRR